jgi:uncharacterized protein
MPSATLYVDTSVLVSVFTGEKAQTFANEVLQDTQWAALYISDWTISEFSCAIQAKVNRGELTPLLSFQINQALQQTLKMGAMHCLAVLREDFTCVQHSVPALPCLVRSGDALHIAIAARKNISHFFTFDNGQKLAVQTWLPQVICT